MTTTSAELANKSRWRRKRTILAILLIIIIIILLLLRSCLSPVVKFEYFKAKAAELSGDRAKVLVWARDQVGTLGYRGDAKGPLATLWNGAGSPEEKLALANAVGAYCADKRAFGLDEVAPARNKAADLKDAKPATITITHRLIVKGKAQETVVFAGSVGELTGRTVALDYPDAQTAAFTATKDGKLVKTAKLAEEADSEELLFAVTTPGRNTPVTVTRELWHKDNKIGPNHPDGLARHDMVILPARVSKFVREKEELILKESGRRDSMEGRQYLALLDYLLAADEDLAKLEKKMQVTAQFDVPRIIILSRYPAPNLPGGIATTMDLRLNRITFAGDKVKAYHAAQVRSYTEAAWEQRFLARQTDMPCTSTFDLFSRFHDDDANTPTLRVSMIADSLETMASHGGMDAKVTFKALNPVANDHPTAVTTATQPAAKLVATGSEVVVARTRTGGFHVKSGPVNATFAAALAKVEDGLVLPPAGLGGDFPDVESAAPCIEAALLGAAVKPAVDPAYILTADIDTGTEPLVCKDASFTFKWTDGDTEVDQRIRTLETVGSLQLRTRVQTEIRPVAGTRTIAAEALASSHVHNPWYQTGASDQEDATSFVISRDVFAALKDGKSTPFALQARLASNDDPRARRRIETQGTLAPAGTSAVTCQINGQPVALKLLTAKFGAQSLAILDDTAYPIGMADKLISVTTAIRGKVLDQDGVPVADATISSKDNALPFAVTSWPDGSFRIPPATDGSDYGKVIVEIQHNGAVIDTSPLDLTAPGLRTLEIRVNRPAKQFVFITAHSAGKLDDLPLSAQIKRHAKADLEAGRMVVIPNQMISFESLNTCGYFAVDTQTGDFVGVTEDGINGSDPWQDAAMDAGKAVWKAKKGLMDSKGATNVGFHMFRGAVTSWWVYSAQRLEGDEHREAIVNTLQQMDYWAGAMSLTPYVQRGATDLTGSAQAGDKIAGQFSSLVNSGLAKADDDASIAAFKLGYLGATAYLAAALDDDTP